MLLEIAELEMINIGNVNNSHILISQLDKYLPNHQSSYLGCDKDYRQLHLLLLVLSTPCLWGL